MKIKSDNEEYLTVGQAKDVLQSIMHNIQQNKVLTQTTQEVVHEFIEKKGYIALGYKSAQACLKKELGNSLSSTQRSRFCTAARIAIDLGLEKGSYKEAHMRALGLCKSDKRLSVYKQAISECTNEKVTAKIIRKIIDNRQKEVLLPSVLKRKKASISKKTWSTEDAEQYISVELPTKKEQVLVDDVLKNKKVREVLMVLFAQTSNNTIKKLHLPDSQS